MPQVLTLNGGSSSIRFAVYGTGARSQPPGTKLLDGKIERIGGSGARLTAAFAEQGRTRTLEADAPAEARSAVPYLMNWLGGEGCFTDLAAVGHRVVHGMQHPGPVRVTPELIDELTRIVAYDPEHLPREIELIDAVNRAHPQLPQVACFDTAFHRTLPRVATLLPIPRRFEAKGVRRYGFHGLSYTYLMEELVRLGDRAAGRGRVLLAHLGSGASLAAVLDGRCIDTSMGFTPASGLVMGTRTGDLDPGVLSFLAATESMDAAACGAMVNHESGLRGVSQTSADMRDLLDREAGDVRAAEAVALFCYQAKKWIGSFAAVLGGLDTLVFSGGIGENAAAVRERVCAGLEFLGVELDADANRRHAGSISSRTSRVAVRIIRTDEESVIEAATRRVLGL